MRTYIMAIHLLVCPSLLGQTPAQDALMRLRSAKFEFPVVASSDWEKDDPAPTIDGHKFGFHIDGIDQDKRHARIIGNAGAEDLALIVGDLALHFVEMTGSGNMNTTIFDSRSRDGRFKAVHSRHWIGGGAPTPVADVWILSQVGLGG